MSGTTYDNNVFDLNRDLSQRPQYYSAAFSSLRSFCGCDSLNYTDVTPDFVSNFVRYLLKKGKSPNTALSYYKAIKGIYNKDKKKRGLEPSDAFDTIPPELIDATAVLTEKELSAFATYDFKDMRAPAEARDIFMFSFFSQGLDYKELSILTESMVTDGVLKAGNKNVLWLEQLEKIRERYKEPDSTAILPILQRKSEDSLDTFLSVAGEIAIGRKNLNMKMAAATWRSIEHGFDRNDLQTTTNALTGNKRRWYAARNYSFDERESINEIARSEDAEVRTFTPHVRRMQYSAEGSKILVEDKIVNSLTFINTTASIIDSIHKRFNRKASVLFSMDGLKRSYTPIQDYQMRNFMLATNGGLEPYVEDISEKEFQRGQRVRVAGDALFDGLTGVVADGMIGKDSRIRVSIDVGGSVISVFTTMIHHSHIVPIE